jgi:hypothetical protein
MASNYTLKNILSSTVNPNIAYCNAWIPVENNAGRPLYAEATYITNLDDINISLSASNVDIGSVHITDIDTGLAVTIADVGAGVGAMRVLSQDLESNIDDISIGDKDGKNFASIFAPTSSLNVNVTNSVTAVQVLNPVSAFSLTNQITSISVTNFPTQLTAVSVTNFPTQLTSVNVTNFPTQLTAVSVTNQLTGITILNPVTAVQVLNPVTSFTTTPDPIQLDAFGRLRVSTPLTLFDSSHRYRDNNLWSSLTAVGGTYAFNQNQGLMDLTVSGLSGSSVIRETTKAFAYQPGKSLLILNTFVFAPSSTNLRQRTGYYGADNGIYVQLDGGVVSFVERSLVNGSPSTESIVPISAWNVDKLDGTGPSGFTLDITKAQISWMDIEWLGVGTVRCGFVIDGKFVHCHSFHHANRIASTYITTASLPLRYEITNKAATGVTKTMKQICSSVISEGGYELRGLQQAIGIPIISPRTFAATNTYYPIVSIRLKTSPDRLDAIVILTALSILGSGNGINYNWQVKASGVTTGGSWVDAGTDSAVEYNISGTSYAGGRILASGFLNASNQASPNLDILKEALFKFQLERNNLTKTPFEITLVAATDTTNNSGMFASMDWEEISR